MGTSNARGRWFTGAEVLASTLICAALFLMGCNGDDTSAALSDGGSNTVQDSTTGCQNGQTSCGGACTNLSEDRANCGSCGEACTEGQVCSVGSCALSCGGGTTKCGSLCVDTNLDPANCGACATACAAGLVCSNGTCSTACTGTLATCGADAGARYCASTATDNANCGSCGTICAAGSACAAGRCSTTCGGGETICARDGGGRYCADLKADPLNCGGCGDTCSSGMACAASGCVGSCPGTEIDCSGGCVDPVSNNQHCGATGGCGAGDAGKPGVACGNGMVCAAGACSDSCPGTQINCNGGCVDPLSNSQFCGSTVGCGAGGVGVSGIACSNGSVCAAGSCSVSCPGTQIACNGGCVDPVSNNQFCGATAGCGVDDAGSPGTACGNGSVCSAGTCLVSCPGTQINCNGGCVDPVSNNEFCGATAGCGTNDAGSNGTTCGSGNVCSAGRCVVSCPGTQLNCNGGCVDPLLNNQFCGATAGCGANDAGSPGTLCDNGSVCTGGMCVVSCPGTQISCSVGCVDPLSNNQFCGATPGCGTNSAGSPGIVCGNGTVCAAGACVVSCPGAQIDCNGGCVDPLLSNQYCGATAGCGANDAGSPGTACGNGSVCSAGACLVSCPGTQINCNGGCVDPLLSNQYCGATAGCGANATGSPGTACGGGSVCSLGSCTATCGASLSTCNNSCVDEHNDPLHCGSCNPCTTVGSPNQSSPTLCESSACVIGTCAPGFANCNAVVGDGCEASTAADVNNCGSCGHVCPLNAPVCAGGTCSCLPLGGAPPVPCALGTDPEAQTQWVICTASCSQAWLSSTRSGGTYHALQICRSLGYTSVGGWTGNYGTVCGTNQGAGSCSSPQTPSFTTPISQPDLGTDQFGPVIGNTVEWQCLP